MSVVLFCIITQCKNYNVGERRTPGYLDTSDNMKLLEGYDKVAANALPTATTQRGSPSRLHRLSLLPATPDMDELRWHERRALRI